jgi:branched-chain amino acid transport system permease protein
MVKVRNKSMDKWTILSILIIGGVLAAVPAILGFNNYKVYLAAQVVIVTTMVVAWNIIGGYAGQLDLAAAGYLAIGGAVSGLLLAYYNITPWIGMPLGALAAIGIAIVIGYPTFRFGIKEVWYALLTAALVLILQRTYWLIYGTTETYMPIHKFSWYHLRFDRYEPLYYLAALILLVTLWINIKIKKSKLGYYLAAIGEDELAAEALGIDVRKYKLYALMIYAGLLGFLGGIYVNLTSIVAYKMFDPWLGIKIAVMGIVGGLGSVAGAFTSGILLRTIEEYLRGQLGAIIPGLYLLIYGILLIIVGIFKPEGFAGIIQYFKEKIFKGGEE